MVGPRVESCVELPYCSRLAAILSPESAKGMLMRALLIAVAIGAVLAAGAGLGAGAVLSGVANGKPVNSQLYNYGQR
jgi:hypothetical protein